jgi:hypothetical protein
LWDLKRKFQSPDGDSLVFYARYAPEEWSGTLLDVLNVSVP